MTDTTQKQSPAQKASMLSNTARDDSPQNGDASQDKQAVRAQIEVARKEMARGQAMRNQDFAIRMMDHLEKRNRYLNLGRMGWMLCSIALMAGSAKLYFDGQRAELSLLSVQHDLGAQAEELRALRQEREVLQSMLDNRSVNTSGQPASTEPGSILETLNKELATYRGQLETLTEENASLQSQVSELQTVRERSLAAMTDVSSEVKNLHEQNQVNLAIIDKQKSQLDQVEMQIKLSRDRANELEGQLEKRKDAFDALAKRYQVTREELDKVGRSLDQANETAKSEKLSAQEAGKRAQIVQSKFDALQSDFDALQTRYSDLQGDYALLKESLRNVVQPVMPKPAG